MQRKYGLPPARQLLLRLDDLRAARHRSVVPQADRAVSEDERRADRDRRERRAVARHGREQESSASSSTVRGVADPPITIAYRAEADDRRERLGRRRSALGRQFFCGPDLKDRFDEPSAPTTYDEVERNEINPITYCLVLRESADADDHRPARRTTTNDRYYAATTATRDEFQQFGWPAEAMKPFAAAWRDTALPERALHRRADGLSPSPARRSAAQRSARRKREGAGQLAAARLSDEPLSAARRRRAGTNSRLGASKKNLAEMTPRRRQVVFDDAKLHALGLLYHLQTTVAERDLKAAGGKPIVTFRDLELTDEFGTPDRLPPKPYVREGSADRLPVHAPRAGRSRHRRQSVLGRDDGPRRRVRVPVQHRLPSDEADFQGRRPRGTWTLVHTKHRNWSTDTDRAMVPLRSFVPREIDGLIVAGKNLGVSSIVQSALRLHGHGMHAGQAAATIAAVCLSKYLSSARNRKRAAARPRGATVTVAADRRRDEHASRRAC